MRDRMGESTAQALFNSLLTDRRDYTKVRCPALAFFAETMPDVGKGNSRMTVGALAWDKKYMAPFRAASIERVKQELPGVEIVNVPGAHVDFVLTNREQVVSAMRRFLSGTAGLSGSAPTTNQQNPRQQEVNSRLVGKPEKSSFRT